MKNKWDSQNLSNANIHGRSQSVKLYATSATISETNNCIQSSVKLTGLSMTTFVGYENHGNSFIGQGISCAALLP